MPGRQGAILAVYALLALLVVPVFPHFVSPNELGRWAAGASLVESGTLALDDRTVALLGPRFEDLSEARGKLYPNKAPGLTFAGLPGYLAVRPAAGEPGPGTVRLEVTGMRWAAATVPLLLLAPLLWTAGRGLGVPAEELRESTFLLLFATPLLAYGLQLFSHALVAACLFGAFVLLFTEGGDRPGPGALAGALLGLAVATEYPAAVPAGLLAGCAAWGGSRRRSLALVLGAAPFAAGLLAYHAACFGHPLALPVGHERFGSFQSLRRHGVFGVGWPGLEAAWRLVLDPSKGLLVLSPVLALGVLGARRVVRLLPRPAAVAFVSVPLSLFLLYAGFPDWHGGFTVGARYLAPIVPFLVLAGACRPAGGGGAALAGASVAAVAVTSLVFPFVPPGFPLPWGSFAAPLLGRGLVAPNLLHLVSRPLAVAVPFLLVGLASVLAFRGRRLAFFALGALLWLGAGLALPLLRPLSPPLVVQRAYVEDVYFERTGALEQGMPAGVPVPPRLEQRRALERTLPPTSWPF